MTTSSSRRRFLKTTGAATAVAAGANFTANNAAAQTSSLFQLSSSPGKAITGPVEPPTGNLPFLHGVASGDPLPTSVVLWTRVTPAEDAMPGSGKGESTELRWEVSKTPDFAVIVRSGTVRSDAATDHTISVDPYNLEPSTVYFYRFTVVSGPHAGAISPVGRTQTAPPFDSSPEKLRFGLASCANYESGFFSAYQHIANQGRAGELDLLLFVGDYIYEYKQGEYSGFGPVRLHHPPHEILTLEDYRIRYGRYRTDPDLQNAHAALPWILTWDDHEFADDAWRGGAVNHQPEEGDWDARRKVARQAYFEWLPIRATNPSAGGHIYRSFTFGDLAQVTMMDLRTYRDESLGMMGFTQANSQARTMMGTEQMEWLMGQIETSSAKWNVLGNSVMFSTMNVINLEADARTRPVAKQLAASNIRGISMDGDAWDGYGAERERIVQAFAANGKTPLFLTGDIHTEWGHNIPFNGKPLGAEMVCASISAPNINESLNMPADNDISRLAAEMLKSANPNCRHVNLDYHGFATVTITSEEADMKWYRLRSELEQNSPVYVGAALTWRKGRGF